MQLLMPNPLDPLGNQSAYILEKMRVMQPDPTNSQRIMKHQDHLIPKEFR